MQSLSHHPQLSFNLVVSSVDPYRSPENTAWKHWSKQMHINHQGVGGNALHSAFPTMSLTDLISSWTSDPDTSSLLSAWPLLFWLHLPLLPLRFGTPLASGTAPSWEHTLGLSLLESAPLLGQGSGQTPAKSPRGDPVLPLYCPMRVFPACSTLLKSLSHPLDERPLHPSVGLSSIT